MTLAQLMIILWVIPNVYLATSFPHANKERILLDKMYLPSGSSLCNASSDAYTVKIQRKRRYMQKTSKDDQLVTHTHIRQ